MYFFARILLAGQHVLFWFLSSSLSLRRGRQRSPSAILVVRTCALGDFLFAIPALKKLRRSYKSARIVLLTATSPAYRQRNHPGHTGHGDFPWLQLAVPSIIDQAICIHDATVSGLIQRIRPQILKSEFSHAVILAHPTESGLGLLKKIALLRLVGFRGSIYGYKTRTLGSAFRSIFSAAGAIEHRVWGPLRSVAELPGAQFDSAEEISSEVEVLLEGEDYANGIWSMLSKGRFSVIAVSPGSIQPHKRWPLDKFAELCRILVEEFSVRIVVVGTKADRVLGEEIQAKIGSHATNLCGETTIVQLASVLRRCILLVGNDGGSVHLGSAVGCPAVSIVPGIEPPNSIEPWNSRHLAVRHPIECSPCYDMEKCPAGHNRCMTELPLAEVLSKCRAALIKPSNKT